MKWFKHMTDSLDDPFVFDLIEQFGGDGYLIYFGCITILAKNFDVEMPGISKFSVNFLRKKLQVSKKKLVKILNFCNENEKIFVEIDKKNENLIILNCPKLKEICDEWTNRKLSSDSVVTTKQLPPYKDKEEDKEEDKENKYHETSDQYKLSKMLLDFILQRNEKYKLPNLQTWSDHIDKLIRIDKRTTKEIENVINWCQNDIFWQNNILSTSKLRHQFDRLFMQMNNGGKKAGTIQRERKFKPKSDDNPYPIDVGGNQ